MTTQVPIYPSERVDDLLTKDLKIIQSKEVFSFSMDAVLLARFVTLPKRGKIMDLCTGNGVIPLLLSTRTESSIDGVEIQERLYDMALRSMKLNGKEKQISIFNGDIKNAEKEHGAGTYDVVTCNPPYLPGTGGDKNSNPYIAVARHEMLLTLEEVVRVSSRLVRSGGRVAFVHRPSRLVDLFILMRKYGIEPKRLRLIHPKKGTEANMVLVEGRRNGGSELKVLPPLIVYKEDGTYEDEISEIYYGKKECLNGTDLDLPSDDMTTNKPYCVYMLECADGSLYTGITNDLEQRFRQHNEGKASKYTRSRLPVRVVYTEQGEDKSWALRRELEIKRLNKKEKITLITVGRHIDKNS